jgi:hypothetical protein
MKQPIKECYQGVGAWCYSCATQKAGECSMNDQTISAEAESQYMALLNELFARLYPGIARYFPNVIQSKQIADIASIAKIVVQNIECAQKAQRRSEVNYWMGIAAAIGGSTAKTVCEVEYANQAE